MVQECQSARVPEYQSVRVPECQSARWVYEFYISPCPDTPTLYNLWMSDDKV